MKNEFLSMGSAYLLLILTLTSCTAAKEELSEVKLVEPIVSISAASASRVKQNSSAVTFQLTFLNVTNAALTSEDVILHQSGSAECVKSVTDVSPIGATVSLTNCRGDGTVQIQIRAGSATDVAGVATSISARSASFVVDNTGVSATQFSVPGGSYLNPPSSLDLIFVEAIDGTSVSTNDFNITGTCQGVSIDGITWLNNTVSLNLANTQSCAIGEQLTLSVNLSGVIDALGNIGTGTTSVAYTFSNVGPTSAIFLPATSAVNSNFNSLTLTPSGFVDVASVDANDFVVSGSCAGVTINSVSVNGSEITVNLSGASACVHGETIIISTDLSGINDTSGSPGAGLVTATYDLDSIAPTYGLNPMAGTLSALPNSTQLVFSVDTQMDSISLADFSLSGSCSGVSIAGISKAGTTVTVNYSGVGSCADTENVELAISDSTIFDIAGNAAVGPSSVSYVLDNVGPQANIAISSGIVRTVPGSILVTYDADTNMSSVTAVDFAISGSCAVNITGINKVSNSVTVNFSGHGACTDGQTVTLTALQAGVADLLGNAGVGTVATTLTVDQNAPIGQFALGNSFVNSIPQSIEFNLSADTDMDSIGQSHFVVSGSCAVALVDMTKLGTSVTLNLSGTNACAHGTTVSIIASLFGVVDTFGNPGSGNQILNLTVDKMGPTIGLQIASGRMNPLPTSITAAFSADTNMSSVSASDFSVTSSCAVSVGSLNISGQSVQVSLDGTSTCLDTDSVIVSIDPASVTDQSGNAGSESVVSVNYILDISGPMAQILPASGTYEVLPQSISVVFDSDVNPATISAADFSLGGTCAASIASVSVSGNVATLNLSGTSGCTSSSTLSVSVNQATVQDVVGNSGVGLSSQIYTKQ